MCRRRAKRWRTCNKNPGVDEYLLASGAVYKGNGEEERKAMLPLSVGEIERQSSPSPNAHASLLLGKKSRSFASCVPPTERRSLACASLVSLASLASFTTSQELD